MSHLSDIGFTVKDQAELKDFLGKITKVAEQVHTNKGTYLVYRDPSKAELWMPIKDGKMTGITPYYSGISSRLIRITKAEKRDAMDGAFTGWVKEREKNEQGYPITFDVPDFYTMPPQQLPEEVNVQIAAFADSMRIETEAMRIEKAKTAAEGKKGILAEQAFIPTGQFATAKNPDLPITANALLSGRVLRTEKKTNAFTGEPYLWIWVKTLSAEIDVVCDLKILEEVPVVDSVITGNFWIAGKILNPSL